MIAEAIEKILNLGKRADAIEVIPVPGENRRYIHMRVGDKHSEFEVQRPDRRWKLETLADVIAVVTDQCARPGEAGDSSVIFYDDNQVVVSFSRSDLVDAAWMDLEASAEYLWFYERVGNPLVDPIQLRKDLRYILRDTMDPNDMQMFTRQISNVTWGAGETGTVMADRAGESMGREIRTSLESQSEMPPETVRFSLPRFAHPSLSARFVLDVYVDPDHTQKRWIIKPVESSMRKLDDAAMQFIRLTLEGGLTQQIEGAGVELYQGRWAGFSEPV